jgi:hypothetical protein
MADLKTSPTNIEQSRKNRIVKVLIEDCFASIRYKDGKKCQHYDDKSQSIPWSSLSYFIRYIPNLDVLLSERYPTIGVAIPSQSCPERSAVEAADVFTIVLRKKSR